MQIIPGSKTDGLNQENYSKIRSLLNLYGDMDEKELSPDLIKKVRQARIDAENYGIEPEDWE